MQNRNTSLAYRAFDAAFTAASTASCRLLCWALRLRGA